jgi:hypothetical protein
MKAYEDHQRKEGTSTMHSMHHALIISRLTYERAGKPVNHAFAKELIAGFVGGEIDKLAETKGMDWMDREKAKHRARKNAEHMYEERYERGNY